MGPGLDVLGCAVTGAGDAVMAEWCDAPGVVVRDPGHARAADGPGPAHIGHRGNGRASAGVRRRDAPARFRHRAHRAQGVAAVGGPGRQRRIRGRWRGRHQRVMRVAAPHRSPARRVSRGRVDGGGPASSTTSRRRCSAASVSCARWTRIDVVRLPVPEGLYIVLAYPAQRLRTADARAVLPAVVDRATALHQAAQVGAIVAALASGDLALLGRAIDDRIAEPARAPLIPGFREAKAAALTAGALGASISGAGPTTFALAGDLACAQAVAAAMEAAFAAQAITSSVRSLRGRPGGRTRGDRSMTSATTPRESYQRCAACGSRVSVIPTRSPRCASCGGLLEVVHAPPAARGADLRAVFAARRSDGPGSSSGVWRYHELVLPNAGDHVVSHPEGNTPLLARDRVSSYAGRIGAPAQARGTQPDRARSRTAG